MSTDPTTQAELDAMPANREQQYAALFARAEDTGYDGNDAEQEIDESILNVERSRHFEVVISTGGPGEWLEGVVDGDGELEGVTFACAWWSEVQRTPVAETSALWRLAERMNPYQFE